MKCMTWVRMAVPEIGAINVSDLILCGQLEGFEAERIYNSIYRLYQRGYLVRVSSTLYKRNKK